jgi:hypothetical protein
VEKFLFAVEGAHRKVRALEWRAVPLVFEEEKEGLRLDKELGGGASAKRVAV